jgi:hypothetical protein
MRRPNTLAVFISFSVASLIGNPMNALSIIPSSVGAPVWGAITECNWSKFYCTMFQPLQFPLPKIRMIDNAAPTR